MNLQAVCVIVYTYYTNTLQTARARLQIYYSFYFKNIIGLEIWRLLQFSYIILLE